MPAATATPTASHAGPSRPGGWLQRLRQAFRGAPAPAAAGIDPSTGLLTAGGLARSWGRVTEPGRTVTAVLFEMDDLEEVRDIYGPQVRRAVVREWGRRLRAAAGGRGWAARTGPLQFLLVLPATRPDQAQALLGRSLGSPPRLEFDAGGLELLVVPDVLALALTPRDGDLHALLGRMAGEMGARREARRQRENYLEHERVRHSRPMH